MINARESRLPDLAQNNGRRTDDKVRWQTCDLRNRNFLYLHLRVTPLRFSRSVFTSVAANHASIYSLIRRLINKVEPVEYRAFGRFAGTRVPRKRDSIGE